MVFMDRNSEVIPSISDKWWSCFQWFLPAMPQCLASTRTIFVCEFDGGVVMGADTRTSTGLSHAGWKLICTVWEAPNFRLLNQTSVKKELCFVTTTFSYIDLCIKKMLRVGRPIRCQSSFTQDLQGGDPSSEWARNTPSRLCVHNLLLKLFLAEVVHSLADVPLVLLVRKPMDLMGQSLSQLHFTFQMETRSCFLGVSRLNHWLLDRYTIEFSCAVAAAQLTPRWGLPNTSVSSLEEARLSYSYNIHQYSTRIVVTVTHSTNRFWVGTGWQALTTFVQHYLGQHAVELGLEPW